MQRAAVLNIVGLSPSLLGEHTPRLKRFAEQQGLQSFAPPFPAVTCTAQSSMLTGGPVADHGIVGNGWYDRESAEVRFWKQSNHLVHGEKIWDHLRKRNPGFTCAQLFWWFNMYSSADWAMTPRPLYLADGRKVFDIHTQPMDLREAVKKDLGDFPFPSFWGPAAGINCSKWIAAAARWTEQRYQPTLSLVYLPHLDYSLQKWGPAAPQIPAELCAIDQVAGELFDFYENQNVKVLVVSEYGISAVDQPVHLNREFRKRGWIQCKDEVGRETLDVGGCRVFAVADHQVAHIYVQDAEMLPAVRAMLEATPGVDQIRTASELWGDGKATARGGDLIAIAKPNTWFTYYFWEDDAKAPDYARTIDIHRKPGYDPVELFIDPAIRSPKLAIAKFLLKKQLGFRAMMEVIPLDATLIKGSHGRDQLDAGEYPLILGAACSVQKAEQVFEAIAHAVEAG
jgi:predicted AlkP superfamily pyrophosphatase or phosphodiesterase